MVDIKEVYVLEGGCPGDSFLRVLVLEDGCPRG